MFKCKPKILTNWHNVFFDVSSHFTSTVSSLFISLIFKIFLKFFKVQFRIFSMSLIFWPITDQADVDSEEDWVCCGIMHAFFGSMLFMFGELTKFPTMLFIYKYIYEFVSFLF